MCGAISWARRRARSIACSPDRSTAFPPRRAPVTRSARPSAISSAVRSSTSIVGAMSSAGAPKFAQHPELAVLTADEMRRVEKVAFARGLSSFEAMRRAGQAVAELIARRWLLGAVDRIIVLCGPGNNGGDGFIAATALRAAGYAVQVQSVALNAPRSADATKAAAGWGDAVAPLSPKSLANLGSRTIVIDALFGIGLARPLAGDALGAVEAVNDGRARVVAVDVPSGVDADNGNILGAAIRADV